MVKGFSNKLEGNWFIMKTKRQVLNFPVFFSNGSLTMSFQGRLMFFFNIQGVFVTFEGGYCIFP